MILFRSIVAAATFAAVAVGLTVCANAAGDAKPLKEVHWSFNGPFGGFDMAAAQRGFQVYKEVCASCHAMEYFRFRNLADLGYPEEQIKAIAAEYTVAGDPDDAGDPTERNALPKDPWPSPFANDNAARASNGGALPPDLSLIVKARHHGADYLYSLLTGYDEVAPADVSLGAGQYYNPWFAGGAIGMPAPLSDDLVEYQDGTPATVDQMARDVTMFLTFVAEPNLPTRHLMGVRVMVFLSILTILFYLSMKRIWKPVKAGRNLMEEDA